ncbi:hybrid sensor histidine kinase/response regulator [Anaerolineae bacterium CFX9]|nr:hybrid sensor histidine kinase/response regulator [Anaerolineae bacterium CFX9]
MTAAPERSLMEEKGNLLVIDDEEEILKALYRQFRRDYNVFTARSAEDGFKVMIETPIQVIISDQRMPGMNGSEFFGRVKNEFPDAIRLLLTGYADIQAVIAAVNDGNIYRYITKPWNPLDLSATVREAFERYHLIVQNRRLLIELQEANALLESRVAERTALLEDANARLAALNAQKDAFMGMAAHDLRTPITIVQGFIDLLLHPKTPPGEFREFVMIIQETMQNMLNLLNDILDITAIESGNVALKPTKINVREFMDRIIRFNRMIGDQKQIHLELDLQPDLPEWTFDPGRIEQVLNNLIGNAFKFSFAETTTCVSVSQTPDGLSFSVRDQGQGIPADEIDKVFGAFQKVSTQPTGNEMGTGLGLSICKRIVELHGGRIFVESTPGEGTIFTFTLPSL